MCTLTDKQARSQRPSHIVTVAAASMATLLVAFGSAAKGETAWDRSYAEFYGPPGHTQYYGPIVGESSDVARVIDGDTIDLHGQRFRFYGIDAPESSQTCHKDGKNYFCGEEAAAALTNRIGGKPVTCKEQDTDKYQRIVAICYVDGIDLNQWMVAHGHALAYRSYSMRYVSDEISARNAHLGIWSGTFEKPWEYRHNRQN